MSALMFSEADRLRLFTRDELQERLGGVCTVDWFLREFNVPTRCKGRVIAGADLVRALASPPPSGPEKEERPIKREPRRQAKPKAPAPDTCAGLRRLPTGKARV